MQVAGWFGFGMSCQNYTKDDLRLTLAFTVLLFDGGAFDEGHLLGSWSAIQQDCIVYVKRIWKGAL